MIAFVTYVWCENPGKEKREEKFTNEIYIPRKLRKII